MLSERPSRSIRLDTKLFSSFTDDWQEDLQMFEMKSFQLAKLKTILKGEEELILDLQRAGKTPKAETLRDIEQIASNYK